MFNLKELRQENGLKRSELARILNINQNTLANYENSTRQAPYEMLILFADFFGVSLDELLGRQGGKNNTDNAALLTAREKKLLSKYRALSSSGKTRVEDYVSLLCGYEGIK
jgi:bacteriophage CI repressor helix-turn-helix domain